MKTAACSILSALSVAVLAMFCLSPARAQEPPTKDAGPDLINADRPGASDGSGVVGLGVYQIEFGVQSEFRRSGAATDRTLSVPALFRVGLGKSWEFRFEDAPFNLDRAFDGINAHTTTGYSPFSLGAKYRFHDASGALNPSGSLIVRVWPASGSSDFSSRPWTGDIRLASDMDLTKSGDWGLNPNIGVGYFVDDAGNTYVGAEFSATLHWSSRDKRLNPFVDLAVLAPEARHGRVSGQTDIGVAYIVNPSLQIDFTVGAGFLGARPPRSMWSAGVAMRL